MSNFLQGQGNQGIARRRTLYAAQARPQIDAEIAKKGRFRIWSPPFLQGLCVLMTGTGLLPYIRPLFKSNSISWASMKSARIVLFGQSVLRTSGNFRFSIRRSDLFCHRSIQSLRNFGWGNSLVASVVNAILSTRWVCWQGFIAGVMPQDGPAHTCHLVRHGDNRFVPAALFAYSVDPPT